MREVSPAGGLHVLFDWLARVGFSVDIPSLRREFPDVPWHSLRDWASEQDWTPLNPRPESNELCGCGSAG